ncbi:MAG: hypothetical protein GY785_13200 [Gammaproteobacteria bacterium]|nr:hypothetical protein [Gammaproteobacteria bacterium]
MFIIESEEGSHYEDLTIIRYGMDRKMSQMGTGSEPTRVQRFLTSNVGYIKYRYGVTYDQHSRVRPGFIGFGLLDEDSPDTWTYDRYVPNDSIFVFPHDDPIKAALPAGFCANSLLFIEDFMVDLVEDVYRRPLSDLLPSAGMYTPSPIKLRALRAELKKWRQMETYRADTRSGIVSRREENLALAVIDALIDSETLEKENLLSSERSIKKALEIIHGSDMENISAAALSERSVNTPSVVNAPWRSHF